MDSFDPLRPFFHALVLKPCMCLAFVGVRIHVCCIICHNSNSLVVAVPGLKCAWFVSVYSFFLPIQMLGLEHAALQLSGNISSVLPICAEDGKLQLGAKSYCPFWSFFQCPAWETQGPAVGAGWTDLEGMVSGRDAGCVHWHKGRQCGPPALHLSCLQTPFARIYKHHHLNAFSFFLGSSSNSSTKPYPAWL